MDNIIVKSNESKQYVGQDSLYDSKFIKPFISFSELLASYYVNVYHRRAIRIKSGLLSQIEETSLDKNLPQGQRAKSFLYAFVMNLEISGNAAVEKTGTTSNFSLYNIPSHEFVLDKDKNIYQKLNIKEQILEGFHFKYHSPSSRFYGEPDYLASFLQITSTHKADLYNDRFFENNARPDLAIIYENGEPSREQIEAFKSFFGSSFKGYDNAHKTLILHSSDGVGEKDAKIRFEELGKVQDISFKTLKELNRDEIAVAHGIPPRLLGIVNSGHLGGGNELIAQLHMFNEIEIKPKIELIESFFDSIGIKLVIKPLDVTSFKDDADVVTGLVQTGILSIPEARGILGWQKNI